MTFNKDIFGPDTSSSLTLSELETLVKSSRFLEKSLGSKIDKSEITTSLRETRYIFQKKIIIKRNMSKGDLLRKEDLIFLKAKGGIPENQLDEILNKELMLDLLKGTTLESKHLK